MTVTNTAVTRCERHLQGIGNTTIDADGGLSDVMKHMLCH